nr:uncharacterized protein LOC109754603 [Aegilops tauschii subsp. strangulata]
MNEGPWNFRGDAVLLVPYDGITKPSTIKLETIDIWIQIHDVPDLYAHLVTPLAAKVGEVLFSEPPSHDFIGNFYRIWVRINVSKPLKNVVSMIRDGKRQIYRVKYEILPDWCAVCGMLGHQFKEHGNGVHPPLALVFKELRASWFMRSGRGPGEGRGSHGGHRGGRSGGRSYGRQDGGESRMAEKYNKGGGEQAEDPTVDADDIDVEDASRKRIAGAELGSSQITQPSSEMTQNTNNLLAIVPIGTIVSPPLKRDPKRTKSNEDSSNGTNSAVKNLAGSFEERRRAQ